MNLEELAKKNKEFAEITKKMHEEFQGVFEKWLKVDPRMTMINVMHFPINIIMGLLSKDKDNFMCEEFPELPDCYSRFLKPFEKIKDKWGKISNPEFAELYREEYEKQFDSFFDSPEQKKEYEKWFEDEKK